MSFNLTQAGIVIVFLLLGYLMIFLKENKKKDPLKWDNTGIMVRLSLAAAACMPLAFSNRALAQSVNCLQSVRYDSFATCGGGGKLTVEPTGAFQTGGGCLILRGTPKPGVCQLLGFATTSSAQVSVASKAANLTGPGSAMAMSKFQVGTTGAGRTKTYTSASLTTVPFTFGVGARLNVNNNQAEGSYSGKVTINVTFF